jgi:hypothetical protein
MWNTLALFERHFGGGDLNFFVDLDRVAVDDLAVELEGDFNSECAFA